VSGQGGRFVAFVKKYLPKRGRRGVSDGIAENNEAGGSIT